MENEILGKKQSAFLEAAGEADVLTDNFYLTGGTVLAAFYLRHCYSEDLDFFRKPNSTPSA